MVIWYHRHLWGSGSGKGENVPWLAGDLFNYAAANACHWEGFEYARTCYQQMLAEDVSEKPIGVDVSLQTERVYL
jgi:hypothetical protein